MRRALATLLLVATSGCTWTRDGGPSILGVTPSSAPDLAGATLAISGDGFEPGITVDFDSPADSELHTGFSAALVAGSTRVPLGAVVRASSSRLDAALPAMAPPGRYDLEVRDPSGRIAILRDGFEVVLAEIAVTTAADEADPGATPLAPLGAGLSLREAIAWTNGRGEPRTLTLQGPLTIAMTPPQTAMALTAPGAAILGAGGVLLDFGGINQACITLDGPGQRLVGVAIRGCEATYVAMTAASGGSQVAGVTTILANPAKPYWAYGVTVAATAPTRIGPGNRFEKTWIAVSLTGAGCEVVGNRFHDNSIGVESSGGAALIWQNVFDAQVRSLPQEGQGVSLLDGPGPIEVLQNAFHGNADSGLLAGAVADLTVRNNLFTANGRYGLEAEAAGLSHDHNGYFGNATGAVAAALATGATDLLADPLFVDPAAGDFRLQAGSPAIDVGLDTGLDLNGAGAGRFDGAAPDLGAFERP